MAFSTLSLPLWVVSALGWKTEFQQTSPEGGGDLGYSGQDLRRRRLILTLACRELTLQKGDIVYIHKEVDKNWLEGEHHGRLGIFPANYVEVSGRNRCKREPGWEGP